ncbi:hypothetical protein LTR96_010985 [Exophiala xenobiotica]|nr:hypothetical protein LTR41_011218 [Exophiala xenobiotica]KAK5215147.1 hypothetical protein LTR72_011774 [Exophiala xenobiotica]KAK5221472.1 hypothetical protein LTR47_010930 [Exophiala xenobiotica]KAK5245759.1 hypothetical protein LTS06_008841 [Exophiala xenobiotica]KAK5261372.1 hypothetical protein LTR40_002319 [Exophiala xenobiotica]
MARGGMQLIDIEEAIVQLLLDKAANIEATDNLGKTALVESAVRGKEEPVLLLLDKGANIEATGNFGKTAPAIGN